MKSPSFRIYVLLSVVSHILIVGFLFLLGNLTPQQPKSEVVTINFLTPEDLIKMTQVEEAQKKKMLQANNQVVEQNENSETKEVPENARFLSANNQVVQKQTVAAHHGDFQNMKKAGPQGLKSKELPTTRSQREIAKDLFKNFSASDSMIRQKVANRPTEEQEVKQPQTTSENSTGTGADNSQTNDYVKDVEVGLETMLNTREFKYYSYYNRIRKQLGQHWEGRVREKLSRLFKEGRAPAATNRDRITKLMIVLNDKGTLVRVQVLSDSGVRDLDDAAIEAFRAAAPFPNPPKGIVENDGTVKIRWDFVLET